jgi:hypothetical protein
MFAGNLAVNVVDIASWSAAIEIEGLQPHKGIRKIATGAQQNLACRIPVNVRTSVVIAAAGRVRAIALKYSVHIVDVADAFFVVWKNAPFNPSTARVTAGGVQIRSNDADIAAGLRV